MTGRSFAVWLWLTTWTLCGCAASAGNSTPYASDTELPARWRYEIRPSADLSRLDATICFEGATPRELRAGKDEAAVRLRDARWISPGTVRRLAVERGRIQLGRAVTNGCVAYAVDLAEGGTLGAAVRKVGPSLLASPNVWLWRPERRARGARASLSLVLSEGIGASLPWDHSQDGRNFELGPNAFSYDSHAAFGKLELVQGVHRGVPFEAALLDAETTPDVAVITSWMRRAIELASLGPGGFPASRMHVLLVPAGTQSDPVAFGSVTRGGAGSVLLFVSSNAALPALERDWVLPHELSHLFLPFVTRDHAWFSEGAATYYQEVLRARGGVISEHEALLSIARSTRSAALEGTGRALREESRAMHETYAFRPVYWAGAAFFLMADVELRKRTQGQRSLDTVLVALKTQGADSPVSSIDELLLRLDGYAGVPVFKPLADICLSQPFPALEPILAKLGVQGSPEGLSVDDAAPLAVVRDAIFGKRAAR